MNKDGAYTHVHMHHPRTADLLEDVCRDRLPHGDVLVPPQHQPLNPEDEDDVVPDQHAAFGIQKATQAVREPAWKDLGLAQLMRQGPRRGGAAAGGGSAAAGGAPGGSSSAAGQGAMTGGAAPWSSSSSYAYYAYYYGYNANGSSGLASASGSSTGAGTGVGRSQAGGSGSDRAYRGMPR